MCYPIVVSWECWSFTEMWFNIEEQALTYAAVKTKEDANPSRGGEGEKALPAAFRFCNASQPVALYWGPLLSPGTGH